MKNKNYLKGAAVLLIAAFGLSLAACGGGGGNVNSTNATKNFKYELTKDKSGIKILEYIGTKGGKVVIPAKIENIPVVALGNIDEAYGPNLGTIFGELTEKRIDELKADARKNKYKPDLRHNKTSGRTDRITAVIIPDSVTFIDGWVFLNCEALKSIKLPKNLTYLGGFVNSSITSIVIPEGVTHIADQAFSGSKKLKSVTIPKSIKTIGMNAFNSCSELSEVKLPSEQITYTAWMVDAVPVGKLDYTGRKSIMALFHAVEIYKGEQSNCVVEDPNNGAFQYCPKLSLATRAAIEASGYKGQF
ncbi:MAG: leucine-rich repeat domain-containing protein [Treponema sp.]|nr:leucine-rich repeat domain-containing protein [Treponema sp.]